MSGLISQISLGVGRMKVRIEVTGPNPYAQLVQFERTLCPEGKIVQSWRLWNCEAYVEGLGYFSRLSEPPTDWVLSEPGIYQPTTRERTYEYPLE